MPCVSLCHPTNQLHRSITELEAEDVLPNKLHTGHQRAEKCCFLSLLTLTFDLDIQTHHNKSERLPCEM